MIASKKPIRTRKPSWKPRGGLRVHDLPKTVQSAHCGRHPAIVPKPAERQPAFLDWHHSPHSASTPKHRWEMCPDIQKTTQTPYQRSAELAAEIERPGTDINLIRRQACEGGSRNKGQIDAAKTHNDHEERTCRNGVFASAAASENVPTANKRRPITIRSAVSCCPPTDRSVATRKAR